MSTARQLSVEDACAVIAGERNDAIAVLTMSPIAFWPDLRDSDYRLVGLMGGAPGIGLGLALGAPDRDVWVLDGDGSLLMQLGSLGAIAASAPPNLTHFVFDNGIYAISGAQPTPAPADWEGMFRAAGYTQAVTCTSPEDLHRALSASAAGPRAVVVRCLAQRPTYPAGAFSVSPEKEAHGLHAALAGGAAIAPR